MKEPIQQAAKRYEHIRELDRIAIPLIPTVGVEAAYQHAMMVTSRGEASASQRSSRLSDAPDEEFALMPPNR